MHLDISSPTSAVGVALSRDSEFGLADWQMFKAANRRSPLQIPLTPLGCASPRDSEFGLADWQLQDISLQGHLSASERRTADAWRLKAERMTNAMLAMTRKGQATALMRLAFAAWSCNLRQEIHNTQLRVVAEEVSSGHKQSSGNQWVTIESDLM
eukprot:TRINITY_DN7712_c0_g1_i1.p1 TRINITY_DN7712_c0_g1~~TRINITY_DN7712_c0_g1_i1.p1  ORF type:complete len:155 (-),score=24.78 TRINITY_DN7712_c0_g1_i1:363-827(-)